MDAVSSDRIAVIIAAGLTLLAILVVAVLVTWDRARQRAADKEARAGDRAFQVEQNNRLIAALREESASRRAAEERRMYAPRIERLSE